MLIKSTTSYKYLFCVWILIFFSPSIVFAGSEPIIRVLVKESNRLRFRADKNIALSLEGLAKKKIKSKYLNLKIENNKIYFSTNKVPSSWDFINNTRPISVSTYDRRGIWIGNRRYRGKLNIVNSKTGLKVINHIGIENYLNSVVGGEMPKDWPIEALKAQAVAARTYALRRIGKSKIFDIDSSESRQVYLGIESETTKTKNAVKSTTATVIKHNGRLISALFHSSSGGRTESSGSVWKYQLPYLVSVPDYDQKSPKFYWEKIIFSKELDKVFPEIGGFNNIKIIKKSDTNRVISTEVYGRKRNIIVSGKKLRKNLKLNSTKFKIEIIPIYEKKRIVDIKNKQNNIYYFNKLPKSPDNFNLKITGYGSGHGVGMSQWGAKELASKGASFRKIIHHYYKNVKITRY